MKNISEKNNIMFNKQVKVSIITPSYNSSRYIEDTIKSVISQTYTNWEMIIVDDCSKDNTTKIVEEISKKDSRVKLIRLKKNSGAGVARNIALKNATGRFIAYLDSDDIWYSKKLENQVKFMQENNYGFSCTSYEVIDDKGISKNKKIYMKKSLDYIGFLTNNLLQTVGIMVDLEKVPLKCLEMPDMKKRQDAATWLKILKNGNKCYGMSEVLAKYRRVPGSLSSDKISAAKGVWNLYRNVENLSFPFASYCFVRYAFLAVWKRMYKK